MVRDSAHFVCGAGKDAHESRGFGAIGREGVIALLRRR